MVVSINGTTREAFGDGDIRVAMSFQDAYPDGCSINDPYLIGCLREIECTHYCDECDTDVEGVVEVYTKDATFYHDMPDSQHATDVTDEYLNQY